MLEEPGLACLRRRRMAGRALRGPFVPARMEVISQEPLVPAGRGAQPRVRPGPAGGPGGVCAPAEGGPDGGDVRQGQPGGPCGSWGPCSPRWWPWPRQGLRALPAQKLAEVAREFCPKVIPAGSCREALALAVRAMGDDGALIVCGSFYLAGEIREMLLDKFGTR